MYWLQIVCEKGKMGDSFPKSRRYYDLRLRSVCMDPSILHADCRHAHPCRYSRGQGGAKDEARLVRDRLEQDLGRGCCYQTRDDEEYPVPLIIVSTPCANALQRKRHRLPFLALEPSEKMVKAKGKKGFQHPEEEHDTQTCVHARAFARTHAYTHVRVRARTCEGTANSGRRAKNTLTRSGVTCLAQT